MQPVSRAFNFPPPSNELTPTVIVCDLDEFLFVHRISEKQKELNPPTHTLSESATIKLGSDQDSFFYYAKSKEKRYCVQALARPEFKAIFKRLYEIRKEYGKKNPIELAILTAANYEESMVKKAMDQFYANGKPRFSSNEFPIKFYNFNDLLGGRKYVRGKTILNKGEFMGRTIFPQLWVEMAARHLPELKKKNVWLFDNEKYNCDDAKNYFSDPEDCFSVYHFPSTLLNRGDATFTKEGMQAFQTFDRIIHNAIGTNAIMEKTFSYSQPEDLQETVEDIAFWDEFQSKLTSNKDKHIPCTVS